MVVVEIVPRIDLDAVVVGIHDEVHDTRNGIRAVGCRRTARQNINTLDERCRNLVDVGVVATVTLTRAQALAIDEHQRAFGAQVPQVDRGSAIRAIRHRIVLTGKHLRQLV
jgi:hypothetical protein